MFEKILNSVIQIFPGLSLIGLFLTGCIIGGFQISVGAEIIIGPSCTTLRYAEVVHIAS